MALSAQIGYIVPLISDQYVAVKIEINEKANNVVRWEYKQ